MITCAQIDSKQAYLVKIGDVWLCFSYNTLVCINKDKHFYQTTNYYSTTTTRHINSFKRECTTQFSLIHKVDNIEMLANQLLFESTKEMVVEQITD